MKALAFYSREPGTTTNRSHAAMMLTALLAMALCMTSCSSTGASQANSVSQSASSAAVPIGVDSADALLEEASGEVVGDVYVNDHFGFQLRLPEGWTGSVNVSSGFGTAMFYPQDKYSGSVGSDLYDAINITVGENDGSYTYSNIQEIHAAMYANASDLVETSFCSQPAYAYYETNSGSGTYAMHYYIIKPDYVCTIDVISAQENREELVSEWLTYFDSL